MTTHFSFARRFASSFLVAFLAIAAVQLLKGHTLDYATTQASLWSAVAASIFTATRTYKLRQGQRCALCGDVLQTQ